MPPSRPSRTLRRGARAALAVLCAASWIPASGQIETPPDGFSSDGRQLAARVNGEEILLADLHLAVNEYVMANRVTPDSGLTIPQIQSLVLDQLISAALILQAAQALDVGATPEEIDARMDELRKEIGSPDDFRLMLTAQNLTERELRRQLARQITSEKLLRLEVFDKMVIPDAEAAEYYRAHQDEMMTTEAIRVRHILVRLRPDMSDEERTAARQKIDDIKARLDGGEDFAELAVELSEDAAAANGGDLGWMRPGQVGGPFQVVAFSMEPGQVSDVVAADYGYHLIEVLERREPEVLSLEEARPTIVTILRNEKLSDAVKEYLAGLRAQADVKTFLTPDGASG